MIIQTAPSGARRLAIMMYEHNALCLQFAKAFGNTRFQRVEPFDDMVFVISNHDAGWLACDRDPSIDPKTELPYDLIETPPESIIKTSRLSPDFNERQHAYCGLLSSMHSWGLYNGRYGLSTLVLLDKVAQQDRPTAERMLEGELSRQARLKATLARDPLMTEYLSESKIFQNYKALQFIDTLALYFNRVHPDMRGQQTFNHVPVTEHEDTEVTVQPLSYGVYGLHPFPFSAERAQYAFCGRRIAPDDGKLDGGWPAALRRLPTEWEIITVVNG
jgi:hypothetical protein